MLDKGKGWLTIIGGDRAPRVHSEDRAKRATAATSGGASILLLCDGLGGRFGLTHRALAPPEDSTGQAGYDDDGLHDEGDGEGCLLGHTHQVEEEDVRALIQPDAADGDGDQEHEGDQGGEEEDVQQRYAAPQGQADEEPSSLATG